SGVPVFLLPLIVVIEIISYLTRPISLAIRLFANMMAGHTMLKVFAGFVVSLGLLAGWAPLAFVVALTGLELLIAFLQAYVFAILSCISLNDALNPHAHCFFFPLKQEGLTSMDANAAKLIGAGLAPTPLAGVGVGIGQIFGSYISGSLRNPAAAPKVFGNVLLGFALTEAVALYALVIAMLLLFVF